MKKFAGKLIFTSALCIAFTSAVFAQAAPCDLQLNPVTFTEGTIDTNPVAEVSFVLKAAKSKKQVAASQLSPYLFEGITEGKYELSASKTGFRTTSDVVLVDCTTSTIPGPVNRMVIMWEGDPSKTVNYAWSWRDRNSAATKRSKVVTFGIDPTTEPSKATSGPVTSTANERPTSKDISKTDALVLGTETPASGVAAGDGLFDKGVVNSAALVLAKPKYPSTAKAVGASGSVAVQVTIDEDGYIIEAFAVSGHPLLKQVATMAAKASRFKPTLLSGVPVKVSGIIVYNFQ